MIWTEERVDIIVPFFRTDLGEKRLDELRQSLKDIDPGFPYKLIIAEGQKPCVQNRNDGLKQSDARYILMCDDDVIFKQKDWLKDAMRSIHETATCGIVGFRIEDKVGNVINAGRVIVSVEDKKLSIDCLDIKDGNEYLVLKKDQVAGCCMLIDRTVAGYFPEKLYPGKINSEDVDYMMTVRANGFNILYLGTVPIIHNESTLLEKTQKYSLTEKDAFNHLIFANRWNIRNGKIKRLVEPKDDQKTT